MLNWEYDFEDLRIKSKFCQTEGFCTSFVELKLVKGENGGIYMVFEDVYATGKKERCEVQIEPKSIYKVQMKSPKILNKGWICFENKNGTTKNCQIKMGSESKETRLAHVYVSVSDKNVFQRMYEIFNANGFKVELI